LGGLGSGWHRVAHGADEDLWPELDVVAGVEEEADNIDHLLAAQKVAAGCQRDTRVGIRQRLFVRHLV
jgi:hypothetical protein